MPYGVRLLECLLQAGSRVYLIYSQAAQIVARQEMNLSLPARAKDAQAFYGLAPKQINSRCSAGRNGSRRSPPAQIRQAQW